MRIAGAVPAVIMLTLVATVAKGQNCGSALLAQTQTPAVFQGITLDGAAVARMWAAGNASQYFNGNACAVGCAGLTASPLCVNNGNCIAIAGVNWLNAPCSPAGTRPTRTVFLVETLTASSGGVWAAFNLDHNTTPANDSNYDLDAKASGNYSTASPYIGGAGQRIAVTYRYRRPTLAMSLSWQPPLTSATEALNNSGTSLVTSYAIYYYLLPQGGQPPTSTGSKVGWSRASDIGAGSNTHGYSTTTSAVVTVSTPSTTSSVFLAIGLNFDGNGDPDADSNTTPSSFISAPTMIPLRY
jgi:hypothetical protein